MVINLIKLNFFPFRPTLSLRKNIFLLKNKLKIKIKINNGDKIVKNKIDKKI